MIVYENEIQDLGAAMAKIEKINQRVAVKGLEGGYTYQIVDKIESNWHGFMEKKTYLQVEGTAPKLNGWTLVAVVGFEEGGAVIVNNVPGYSGEMVDRSTLDGHCDICQTKRPRNHVIVCEHPEQGRKVVGGQCVKDLLGHNLGFYFLPDPVVSEEGWGFGSGKNHRVVDTQQVIAVALAATKVWGWVPKSPTYDTPTATYVEWEIVGKGWIQKAKEFEGNYQAVEQFHTALEIAYDDPKTIATVEKIIEWAKALPPTSEFNQNLAALAGEEFVGPKNIGLLAYAPTGYLRWMAKQAEIKAQNKILVNKPLGEPKTKVKSLPAKVTGIHYIDGQYGTTTLVKFQMTSGHKAAWFASNTQIDESWIGTEVLVSGTIKNTSEWQGVVETRLTRCKVEKV